MHMYIPRALAHLKITTSQPIQPQLNITQLSEIMAAPTTFKTVTVNQDLSLNIKEVDVP